MRTQIAGATVFVNTYAMQYLTKKQPTRQDNDVNQQVSYLEEHQTTIVNRNDKLKVTRNFDKLHMLLMSLTNIL